MRYCALFLLLLVLSGCAANRLLVPEKPLSSLTSVVRGDTVTIVLPDTLAEHTVPKSTSLSRLFSGKKIKNNTIIIQTGASSVASPIAKAKAPVAVATGGASATAVEKSKAPVAVTSWNNSLATANETKKDYSWLWYLFLAGGTGFLYYKFKTR